MNSLIKVLFILVILSESYNSFSAKDSITVKVDEENYPLADPHSIYSGNKYIEFNLPDSLNHHAQYWYWIKNYDSHWHRTVYPQFRYSGLPGGDYKLQVSIDSMHNNIIAEYLFDVKKKYSEQWWYWLFVISTILGIGSLITYFWYLYDFRQKMLANHMRQRMAADLHDEIGSNLSNMAFSAELIKKKLIGQSKDLDPLINTLLNNSRDTSSLLSDTIWALNPKHDSFDKLIDKMKSFAHNMLSAKEITYQFDQSGNGPQPSISIEQKRNIYLIYKEAINNIAKHSEATQVNILIQTLPDQLKIEISDNGIGFDTNLESSGNGLNNFKTRANKDNLIVDVASFIGQGTEIKITVPYYSVSANI
ncbi:MAG: hypothetical protein IPK94_07775 [Saprospiraceae bacterium]|nr:hypothetical protein [Saprospiraceae bacterium]